jgi:hypothetical protein
MRVCLWGGAQAQRPALVEEGVRGVSLEVLLSGLIGALLVFLLGVLREWWRDERERRGLMRLLLAEVRQNTETTELTVASIRDEHPATVRDFPAINMEVWSDVRARATQLFPADLFEVLDRYYTPLQTLMTLPRLREFPDLYFDSFMEAYRQGAVARDMMETYLARLWGEHLLLALVKSLDRLRPQPRRDEHR